MGDRANIVIVFPPDDRYVCLYTHWGGCALPVVLQDALRSKPGRARWSDASYLARIIFCRMVRGHEAGEVGYGIGPEPHDNFQHDLLVVNVQQQTVERRRCPWGERDALAEPVLASWSFKAFCRLHLTSWDDLDGSADRIIQLVGS